MEDLLLRRRSLRCAARYPAFINEVMGKSLVWNQLVNTIFPLKRIQVDNTTGSSRKFASLALRAKNIVAGHKYLFKTNVIINENNSVSHYLTYIYSYQSNGFLLIRNALKQAAGEYSERVIYVASANKKTQDFMLSVDGGDYTDFTVLSVICIDLTLMFGEGNEPSTVEEFEAMFPKDYYEYNEGEIISNKTESLEIRNTNDELKTTLPLNLSTITGKLNGEGESVTIFPEGMRGAGAAYDYLVVDADGYARRAVKVMESADMGTLNWKISTSNLYYITTNYVSGAKVRSNNDLAANMVCAKYETTFANDVYKNGVNKIALDLYKRLYCGDTEAYTDAATFKSAMSGVELIYELATPLEYVLDNPIKLTFTNYHNSKFVQIPSPPASAPITVNYRKLGG